MKYLLIVVFSFYYSLGIAQGSKVYLSSRVEALWKSAPVLETPESVLFSKEYQLIFVSNINGKPNEKDGNGFISKFTAEGNVVEIEWIKGLNAPKGMAEYKGHIFVSDIDRLIDIDINKGEIIKSYPVKGAQFLNDVASDRNGNIYVSDSQTDIIYKLEDGVVLEFVKSDKIKGANGLCLSNGDLYIGTKQKIVKVNLETFCVCDYILNTGSIDGLICLENKDIIFSDWSGNIYITALGKETIKLIDTTPLKVNAADIGFNELTRSILVPTFYDNRIMSYKLLDK